MPTFADWLLQHKANIDWLQLAYGFMTVLRYDIQLQTNAFNHQVLMNGVTSVQNILVF